MIAGFAQSDITPRLGVQLVGYGPYRNRAARKITAPLSARAMAVTQGKRRTVLINLDLCFTPLMLARKIREVVAQRIGGKPEDIFVTVTHTHSGPTVGGIVGWGETDAMYLETLPSRIAAAAEQAIKALVEVEWRYAEVPCEGIAINRETDKGGWMFDPIEVRLDPKFRPARPQDTDPTLRVLAAYTQGKLFGVLHHFGCHAVVGSEQTFDVHGDFVGLASRAIERAYPGATAIFLPGAMGDINPPVVHRAPVETKRGLRVLTQKYTAVLKRGLQAAQPIKVDSMQGLQREVKFARKPWTKAWVQKRIKELEKLFSAPGITDDTKVGTPPLQTNGLNMARLEGLRRVLAGFQGSQGPNPPVAVQGLRLGPVALLGVGLEVFHSLQAPVLQHSPHPHTWVVSLVGGAGYAPDQAACAKQGYTDDLVPLIVGERPYAKIYEEVPRELIKLARALK
ncbi:MAG: neutral/alkaline non-lysosomal ceramidase N-terminal domain-containing protein [Cephaloticoccus sp.]|nr:neutral/alkaline non-lysosomal ceramidase N-terminal domain-containing protein [Cephaloticoccus sp.]MCF7759533.1 neutral/alkaline non-lysosomal ceramidase N-terminal domain-containing protein [Cephaloticoccus sp.]